MKKVINISKEQLQECLDIPLTMYQMAERFMCGIDTIRKRLKEYDLTPSGTSYFNSGDKNPAKRTTVKRQIARTVSTLWKEGYYAKRINGMTGKTGFDNFKYTGPKYDFRDYLSKYEDINVCSKCGKTREESKIDVHHVDENHDNWLITNLVPLCVHCHQEMHIHTTRQPRVSISVKSHFDSCHNLLWYNGACAQLHGHRYLYEVTINDQINADTGMVMDFKKLKNLLKEHIEQPLDHGYLNDVLPFNTTAENMIVWMFETLSKRAGIKGIVKISLWETPECETSFTDKDMLKYFMDTKVLDTLDKED